MHSEPTRKGDLVTLTDGTLTEAAARTMFESMRWPNGPVCTFDDCGGSEVYRISVAGKTLKSGRVVTPRELFKCKACRRQFSVTKGTAFEDSKIPLRTWLTVMYRMCSSKKSVSARQIEREFGLSHRAAWFMCHRIRWMMTDKNPRQLKGTVEADETYIGGKLRGHAKRRGAHNMAITGDPRAASLRLAYERKTPVLGIRERQRLRAVPPVGFADFGAAGLVRRGFFAAARGRDLGFSFAMPLYSSNSLPAKYGPASMARRTAPSKDIG